MRIHVFLEPMFSLSATQLGGPAQVFTLGFAVVVAIVGLAWMRRTLTIEPDAHSFRATAPTHQWGRVLAAAGLLVAALLLAAVGLGVVRLS